MADYKSETERAAELQQKAISIRDYMQEPGTMKQIMAALPKWLKADRFVRLFYTAMMKNYKLMDCTKQSLLSCMIEAAQIGLEPVLGKAALIPYKNEVQFQPMYKGLMEVARRFAYISITAHVVYEVDQFEMSWGDDEKIIHVADIRNPEREKSAKLGAYDVWKGADKEIISRRFMPTSQILFIRDTYSKAWKKDGKDSVWGKHEDEQFIKTVIKNHCKLEPQCIEMERAVELDDRSELGRTQLGMGRIDELPMPSVFDFKGLSPQPTDEPGESEQPKGKAPDAPPPADIAKAISAQSGLPVAAIREFISFIAKRQEKTEKWVEENAMKAPDSFIRAVTTRIATLKKAAAEAKEKAPDTNEKLIKEFWNLRVGSGGKTGLKAFVTQNMKHIYDDYPEAVISKLKEKFEAFYPGETFPAPAKTQEAPQAEAKPSTGAGGADAAPPFSNPNARQNQAAESNNQQTQSHAERVGQSIRDGHDEEADLLARYDNSVESVMKFDKSGVEWTIADFEIFMREQAHMEGVTYSSFKADVMRSFQFPEYFDKFIARISGREG